MGLYKVTFSDGLSGFRSLIDWGSVCTLLTVKQRIFNTTRTIIYRLKKGELPECLSEIVSCNREFHKRAL